MMKIPPTVVSFSEQQREEILRRIDRALASGQITQGANVEEFEQNFAHYVGVKHAVATSSGSAAIELAMRLMNIANREVLVPTNTFATTAVSVLFAGGRVRLVDTDPSTFSLSVATLERAVTSQTVGVVIVHIGGIITPEIEAIQRWCAERGLWLFEDAAHAHGAALAGKMAGKFGKAAAYSFFATKVITSGEGGMLVTNDDKLASRARVLRNCGRVEAWTNFHSEIGTNSRMTEFSAAVGIVQLQRLEDCRTWRGGIAKVYTEMSGDIPGIVPVLPQGQCSWYKYILLLPVAVDRQVVRERMLGKGIALSGGVYDIPLHKQPAFQHLAKGAFPGADDVCSRHICLPLYYGMTREQAEYVIGALRATLEDSSAAGA